MSKHAVETERARATRLVRQVRVTAVNHYRSVNEQRRMKASNAANREESAVTDCLAMLLGYLPSRDEIELALRSKS